MAEFHDVPALAGWGRVGAEIIARGQALGLDRYFRAGQSMQHLIFSTIPHHGLTDEWRVTVCSPEGDSEAAATGSLVEVSLGRANRWFSTPERAEVVASRAAWAHVADYLALLWRETKGATPPPAALPHVER